MALRDEIKAFVDAAVKPQVTPVPTPELPRWDGQVYVARVCARAVADFLLGAAGDDPAAQLDERARFVCRVATDRDGSRIFQDEDVLWLSCAAALGPMVERLYWAGREVNGLTEENRTAWRKNSSGAAGGGSPSCCAGPATPASDSTPTAS